MGNRDGGEDPRLRFNTKGNDLACMVHSQYRSDETRLGESRYGVGRCALDIIEPGAIIDLLAPQLPIV
jgi:hypothetical protein